MSRRKWAFVIVGAAVLVTALFPKQETLVPAMEITIRDESGASVKNGEVSRTWNHYLGPGWTTSIAKTDGTGKVRFPEISRRVPLFISAFWRAASIPLHYYPGFAGSIKARNAENHFVWQRVDFNDRDCCPSEVTIVVHDRKGEADDKYFTFGDVVPNE